MTPAPAARSSRSCGVCRASPRPRKASSFSDVSAKDYYAPAVDWAVEEGITNGVSATLFAPKDDCTRAHIVTFLFRCLEQ